MLDDNNDPIPDADFKDVIGDLLRSDAKKTFDWLVKDKEIPDGPKGWSVPISKVLATQDLILDPKRLNRKVIEVRSAIEAKPHFKLGDVVDFVPEGSGIFDSKKTYRYVQIQDIFDGGYSASALRGWQLPQRARHAAKPGDVFVGKIWNSVNKWFMAGGETEDLIVTNSCYRLQIKKEKEQKLPDLIAGLCSEAYRVQMRSFATGSDGLAEINESDAAQVVLPDLQTEEAKLEAKRYIAMYLKGHATLRDYISELESEGQTFPSVPERKTVFVQV